jgi:hypothetical protein
MDQVTSGPASIRELREIGEKVKSDIEELRSAAERSRDALLEDLRKMVDQHPFAAIGVAFAAGYAISGALLSRTTLRAARAGARWYLARMLKERVGSELGGVLSGTGRPRAGA